MNFENSSRALLQFEWLSSKGMNSKFYKELLKKMDEINPDDIRNAARKYLVQDNMTIIINGPARLINRGLLGLAPVKIIKSGRE